MSPRSSHLGSLVYRKLIVIRWVGSFYERVSISLMLWNEILVLSCRLWHDEKRPVQTKPYQMDVYGPPAITLGKVHICINMKWSSINFQGILYSLLDVVHNWH